MVDVALNQTGSKWEQTVDSWMTAAEKQVESCVEYVSTQEEKYHIAAFATSVILAFHSPMIVGASALVGTVVRAFSPEQLDGISSKLSKLSPKIMGLGVVVAFVYAPVLFPVAGGLLAGFTIGAKISPHDLAKGFDKAAMAVEGDGFHSEVLGFDYVD